MKRRNFPFLQNIKAGCGAQPAAYLVGIWSSFSGDKVAGGVNLTIHF